MMGNENSQLNGLEIEEKGVEIADFWCQYQAKINDSCRYFSLKSDGSVSVFKGEAAVGPLWSVSTPLEKFSNVSYHTNSFKGTATSTLLLLFGFDINLSRDMSMKIIVIASHFKNNILYIL